MSNVNDFVIDDGILKRYKGKGGDVVVPDGVTWIGESAFQWCESLESITLPGSLTHIGKWAFSGCKSLACITLPNSVKSIGKNAFSGCTSLENIVLPEGATTSISEGAFYGCGCLVSIELLGRVTSIGEWAFNTGALRTIVAPNTSVEVLKDAKLMFEASLGFFAHRQLFNDADIVKEYEKYAFLQKKKILPEIFKADDINALVFYEQNGKISIANFETDYLTPAQEAKATQCIAYLLDWQSKNISAQQREANLEKELNKELNIDPFSEKEMKKLWSFEILKNGTWCITGYRGEELNVVVPERIGEKTVTAIGDEAFSAFKSHRPKKQCEVMCKLKSITLPNSVKKIGECAFRGCESLTSITIPDSVKSIGKAAFGVCKGLADEGGFVIVRNVLYGYYGAGGDVVIPDGVTSIDKWAFYGNKSITSIKIPKDVKSIEGWAFTYCKSLTSINIPDGVKSIEEWMFTDCRSLASITLPESVKSVRQQAFYGCEKLTIHAPVGSWAEEYAHKKKIPFVAE